MATNAPFKSMPRGTGKAVSVVGDTYVYLMTGAETNGAYALIESIVSPNGGPPPHIHHREDETFYVIEGELEFVSDGKSIKASPGTFVSLPKGTLHYFKNGPKSTARMLVQVCPAGLEQFFDEVGHPMKSANDAPAPVTEADIQKLVSVAPKYGIEIRLPK